MASDFVAIGKNESLSKKVLCEWWKVALEGRSPSEKGDFDGFLILILWKKLGRFQKLVLKNNHGASSLNNLEGKNNGTTFVCRFDRYITTIT